MALLLALAMLTPGPALAEAPEIVSEYTEPVAGEQGAFALEDGDALSEAAGDAGLPEGAEAVPETGQPDMPLTADDPAENGMPLDAEANDDDEVYLDDDYLELGVKETYALTVNEGCAPEDWGAVFTTSNKKVVTVDSAGRLTARKKGTAVITMEAGGNVNTCEVVVRKAPSRITVAPKKMTLGVEECGMVDARLPKKTASIITYTSSDPSVAQVDEYGDVCAVGTGTATITARTFNKKKAACKVTVKEAPRWISLPENDLVIWEGKKVDLKPTLSPGSAGYYWYWSEGDAVEVEQSGRVTGVGRGSATVTVETYNGRWDSVNIHVTKKPAYRALLIGQVEFPKRDGISKRLPGSKKDISMMKGMLNGRRGEAGGRWTVAARMDRSASQIRQDIADVLGPAEEGDVSLFYITTHGNVSRSADNRYASCLYGVNFESTIRPDELASWLGEVRGKVIVLINACGSGGFIMENGAPGDVDGFDPALLNDAFIRSLSAADSGVCPLSPEDADAKVGDLRDVYTGYRENKFYVLTAAKFQQLSFTNTRSGSFFTQWLTQGVGKSGAMKADRKYAGNRDNKVTLHELYRYIAAVGNNFRIRSSDDGRIYKQQVQVYPANCKFVMFAK